VRAGRGAGAAAVRGGGRPARWPALRALGLALALGLAGGPTALGDPLQGAFGDDLSRLDDREVVRRLRLLVDLLEAGEFGVEVWQYGFAAGYGMGVALGVAETVLAEDGEARVEPVVTLVKAVGGTASLVLDPHPGRRGADDVLALPSATPHDRRRQLAAAERLLARAEARTRTRWHWAPHLGNLALNLAGGGIVWALGERGGAISSSLVGIAVGEAMIWSEPTRARVDAAVYRRAIGRGAAPARLELAPWPGGLHVALRF